ncbi:MAG: hypothetical protein L0H19_02850 [Salinisphaera sp.]|nr:hypothetical protein [Salinisphaera sp.]MDN5937768.1 hypothetical protein [Salinisphaera sp.]
MRTIIYFTAIVGVAVSAGAFADTTLVYNAASDPFTIRIRAGEIRIDDSSDSWQLYRRADNAVYAVHPGSDSYTRMDADSAGRIRAQMDALRATMEKRLQTLPVQQRKIARAALAQQIPSIEADAQITVQTTDNTEIVAGHPCRVVRVLHDGKPEKSLCLAKPADLGLSAAEFATVTDMYALMQTMLAGTGLSYVGLPNLKLDGMPIRYQDTLGNQRRTLSRVLHEGLSDRVFQIPPSYKPRVAQSSAGAN